MLQSSVGRFRLVALLEGTSFLILLFIAMPLKYLAGMPLAVRIVGMAHGLLFVTFTVLLFGVAMERDWPLKKSVLAFVASLVPFGTFVLDRKLVAEDSGPVEGA